MVVGTQKKIIIIKVYSVKFSAHLKLKLKIKKNWNHATLFNDKIISQSQIIKIYTKMTVYINIIEIQAT